MNSKYNVLEKSQMIQRFIEKVKLESGYRKFLQIDLIQTMINTFKVNYEKKIILIKLINV